MMEDRDTKMKQKRDKGSKLSLNIRGLGGEIKRIYMKEITQKKEVDMVCIQEIKGENISTEECYVK